MVNWLALGASNYVRSVHSEVRKIFPVFGESLDRLAPRTQAVLYGGIEVLVFFPIQT